MTIDSGSKINADGQGYLPSTGPGAGDYTTNGSYYYYGGGTYGGRGGNYQTDERYGNAGNPFDLGSGGYQGSATVNGNGGGAVKIIATGSIIQNGSITANGNTVTGTNPYGGGGSGGAIYLYANTLTGSGSSSSNGGGGASYTQSFCFASCIYWYYTGSAGGGGRIAVYAVNKSGYTGSLSATGSESGTTQITQVYAPQFSNMAKSDGSPLKTGATTDENQVNLRFWYYGDGNTPDFTPEVEVKPVNQAFDGTGLTQGSLVSTNDKLYLVSVNVSGLSAGSYHWRARTSYAGGAIAAWGNYGSNSEGSPPGTPADTDFTVGASFVQGSSYPDVTFPMTEAKSSSQSSLIIYQNNMTISGAYSIGFPAATLLRVDGSLAFSGTGSTITFGSGADIIVGTLGFSASVTDVNTITISSGALKTINPLSMSSNKSIGFVTGSGNKLDIPSFVSNSMPGGTITINGNNPDFNIATLNNSGGSILLTGSGPNFNPSSFTMSAGSLNLGSNSIFNPSTLNYTGGSITLGSNSAFSPSGIAISSGILSLTYPISLNPSSVSLTGTSSLSISGTGSLNYNLSSLTLNTSGSMSLAGTANVTVTNPVTVPSGTFTISAGTYTAPSTTISGGTINLNGTSNADTNFTVSSGTLSFVGNGSTATDKLTSLKTIAVTGGTLNASSYAKILAPITFSATSTGTLSTGAQFFSSANTFDVGSTKTLTFNCGTSFNAASVIISGGTLASGGNTCTSAQAATYNIYGNLAINSGSASFPSNATINVTGNTTVGGTVTSTLTIGGNSIFNGTTGLFWIKNSSSVIPQGYYTVSTSPGYNGRGVTFNVSNMTIDSGSKINADGQGYSGGTSFTSNGYGPGYGQYNTSSSGGGSYGGHGGYIASYTGGVTYGSNINPIDLGSGGGNINAFAASAGSGGGAVIVVVSGTLNNNGTISANGASSVLQSGYTGGGGSGGSININTSILVGSGTLGANGGVAPAATYRGYGGGGGRVAVIYGDKSGWSGSTSQSAGSGNTNVTQPVAGTIYMPPAKPYNLSVQSKAADSITWQWQQAEATDAVVGFKVFSGAHVDGDESGSGLASIAGGAARTGSSYFTWTQSGLGKNSSSSIHLHAYYLAVASAQTTNSVSYTAIDGPGNVTIDSYDVTTVKVSPATTVFAAQNIASGQSGVKYYLLDESGNDSLGKSTAWLSADPSGDSSWAYNFTGVNPNGHYKVKIEVRNGDLSTIVSSDTKDVYTKSVELTGLNVVPNAPDPGWTNSRNITSVNNIENPLTPGQTGFGLGRVEQIKYVVDHSAMAPDYQGSSVWSSGPLDIVAPSDGTWYLHLAGFNMNNEQNGEIVSGPYKFDTSLPGKVTNLRATTTGRDYVAISWNNYDQDAGSPIEKYQLERVKYEVYTNPLNNWNLTSDWSGGNHRSTGYATFDVAYGEVSFSDLSVSTSVYPLPAYYDDGTHPELNPLLDDSARYIYRIRVKDSLHSQYGYYQDQDVIGLTKDTLAPTSPRVVESIACDGTVVTCDEIDPVNGGNNTRGLSVKVTWVGSSDAGAGVDKYIIYRSENNGLNDSDWTPIGVVSAAGSPVLRWYDNDESNDLTMGQDKTVASPRLNDYTLYYYRVRAVDLSDDHNISAMFPSQDIFQNWAYMLDRTPDVTAPTEPSAPRADAMGIDGLAYPPDTNGDPVYHQKIRLSWGESFDYKARSQEDGSGLKEYRVYRSTVHNGPYTFVGYTNDLFYDDNGLTDVTYFYYKITAVDNANPENENLQGSVAEVSVKTLNSSIPTTPEGPTVSGTKYSGVYVTSKTGNPNTDNEVGHKITVSFTGSYAKNCEDGISCIVGYELRRSSINYTAEADWLDNSKTSLITTIAPHPGKERDDRNGVPYTYDDINLNDASTYFYRVRAIDNTASGAGGPFRSPFSSVTTTTAHNGWDITPDDTTPELPQELKVKDIHDDGTNFKRNIITWKRITTPERNGVNDFSEYRVYRSTDGLTWQQICLSGLENACTQGNPNPLKSEDSNKSYAENQEISLATNYFMDLIPLASANQYYYYYVTAVDDSGYKYKYQSPINTVINNISNESEPARDSSNLIMAVSLNPAIAKPTIVDYPGLGAMKAKLSSVGVTSATLEWFADQDTDSVVEFKAVDDSKWVTIGDRVKKRANEPHVVKLFGLEPNTSYEYRLISRNFLGNEDIVGDITAEKATLPSLKTGVFSVTSGEVTTTTTTATVSWTTNLESDSNFVQYQLQRLPGDDDENQIVGDPRSSKDHKVVIEGLKASRTYTYIIRSISLDNFVSQSALLRFSTRAFDTSQFTISPSASNVADRNITSTTAQIVWQTSMPTTSWVDFGQTSGKYDVSAGDDNLNTIHQVLLTGLIPGNTYYYHVRTKDASGTEYVSPEYSLKAVLKPKIDNLKIDEVTPYQVKISWETNIDTETLINWGNTSAYGEKRGKSESTKAHTLTIDNLIDNTEYHFQIVARDAENNEVVSEDRIVRTPIDKEGPKIINVKTDIMPLGESDVSATVIISWQTDKPASTKVEYDEGVIGNVFAKASTEDNTLNKSHTVIIKDLPPSATYRFRLVSKDKRGNETKSNNYNFLTPSQEKSIWQLIVRTLEETFSWVGNLGKFFGGKK
jgi:hypothetical protein